MHTLPIFKEFKDFASFSYGDTENYKRKYIPWLSFNEFA